MNENLPRIYQLLADRYPAPVTIRRILGEAGLDARRLVVDTASPLDNWFAVVQGVAANPAALRSLAATVDTEQPMIGELVEAFLATASDGKGSVSVGTDRGSARVRPVKKFVGRRDILERIDAALAPDGDGEVPGVVLVGLGGVGKTQIAARYAAEILRAKRYDHVAWLHAETRDKLERDLGALGRDLGVHADTEDTDQLARLTIDRLETTSQSWLLILDNVDMKSTLTGLVPLAGNGALLLTSRVKSLRSSFPIIEVPPLTVDECADYMLAETDSADRAGAIALAEALGGLPLAMAHATAYIQEKRVSFALYLSELGRLPAREMLRSDPTEFYKETVASTWRKSILAATAKAVEAATMLDRLSFLDPDSIPRQLVDGSAAASVAGMDQARLRDAVGALHDYSLIGLDDASVQIHRLVQRVTREDAIDTGRAQPTVEYLTRLLSRLVDEVDGSPQPWPDFLVLRPHILALLATNEKTRRKLGPAGAGIAGLVPSAVRKGLRAASASPIYQVGQVREAIEAVAGLRRTENAVPVTGNTVTLLDYATGQLTDDRTAAKACREITETGDEVDLACALLLTVEKQHTATLMFFLANNRRVDLLVRQHPDWAACVRFACMSPSRDANLAGLEAGVAAGDETAIRVWLNTVLPNRRLSGSPAKTAQVLAKLRRYAPRHQSICLALADLLAKDSLADAIEVLERSQRLGPQVSIRLAELLVANGQRESAIRTLNKVAPSSPEAAMALARLVEPDDADEACRVLEKFTVLDVKAAQLFATIVRRRKNAAEASAMLARPARRWPSVAITLARIRWGAEDLKGAASTLKPHAKDPLVAAEIRRLVARSRMSDRQYRPMLAVLNAGQSRSSFPKTKPDAVPKPSPDTLLLVRELIGKEAWWDAITELVTDALADDAAQRQDAIAKAIRALVAAKDGPAAAAMLRQLVAELPVHVALSLIRQVAGLGEAEAARSCLDPYREQGTINADVATGIARAEEEMGDPAGALRTLAALAHPTINTAVVEARLHEDGGRPDRAVAALQPYLPNTTAVARIVKTALVAQRPQLAIAALEASPEQTDEVAAQIRRLSTRGDATREADFEWYCGDAERALGLLRAQAGNEPRAAVRLIQCLLSLDRSDEALGLLGEWLGRDGTRAMLCAEVAAEYGGLEVAAPLLDPHVPTSYAAAIGLSWLAHREGAPNRAQAYLEAHTKVRGRINQLIQVMTQTKESVDKACTLAQLLRDLGCYGYAEDLLRAYPHAVRARLALADLLRSRLAFAESRSLVVDLAGTNDKAALLLATNWLRNGSPDRAAQVLDNYTGRAQLGLAAQWMSRAYTDAKAATRAARQMVDADLPRCAFEVLQVTEDQQDPTIVDMRKLPQLNVSPDDRNAVMVQRTRVLIADRKLQLKVRPDFRDPFRETLHRARIRAIAAAPKPAEPTETEPTETGD